MNKISHILLEKIYKDKKMTSDELSFMIYLGHIADDYGYARGVYYKDAVEEMGISVSQFYAVKKRLEERGYISCNKEYVEDIDITVHGNSFFIEDEEGNKIACYRDYLNLNRKVFGKGFYKLKVNAKKLLLHIVVRGLSAKKRTKGFAKLWHVPKSEYTIYSRKFGISKRMIKEYFKDIEEWVSVYSEEGNPFDIITAKEEALAAPKVQIGCSAGRKVIQKQDRFDSDVHFVKKHCRRNRIEADEDELNDAAGLISQYINKATKLCLDVRSVFIEALQATTVQAHIIARAINKYISNKLKRLEETK